MMNTGLSRRSKNRTDPATRVASSRGCGRSVMRPALALSGRGDAGNYRVEQAVGGLAADLGLRAQQQSMSEGRPEQPFDIVRGDVVAALERRGRLGCQQQENLGS